MCIRDRIHCELKRSGVDVSQAYNQIEKYAHEGVFSGPVSYTHLDVYKRQPTGTRARNLSRRAFMCQTQHRQAVRLTTTALCIALGLLLPTVFHVFGTGAGTALLPMHLPVLLCGLLCGWQYGAACGLSLIHI